MRPHLAPPAPAGTVAAPRPSFSVVIAAYQAVGTIAEAVESALGQTEPPVEVVVCDDGSTDGTGAALAPYRSRIVYIRQENRGQSAARNAAARHAKGDFLALLDADDVYLPDRLDALAELAGARPDLDVLTADAFLESGGTVLRRCYDPSWPFAVDDQRTAILERCFVLAHAAVRRERFVAAGGFDESMLYAEDWDLWLRLVLDGARVGLVCEPLSRYRLAAGSLSSQRAAVLAGGVRVIEKALARGDLSPAERATARVALIAERRALARAAAREALVSGSPDTRRLALAVALGRGQGPATRLKAVAAAVFPGAASRRMRARPVETAAGLAIDR
jgi:glycosyltransferase involved in cell wall biosynthesis